MRWSRSKSCAWDSPSSTGSARSLPGDLRRRLQNPPGADPARGVPRVVDARDLDDVSGMRRMDELAAADVDPDVPEPVEENEVARLELVARDRDSVVELRRRVVG